MNLQERLDLLDRQFGYRAHPEDFNFALSPERIAYKNEALRTNNRDLYAAYLADHYAEKLSDELESFDMSVKNLVRMHKDEALVYFKQHGINLLKSDISYQDQDAIFKVRKVAEEDLAWYLKDNENDLIQADVTPNQALHGKTFIYIEKAN